MGEEGTIGWPGVDGAGSGESGAPGGGTEEPCSSSLLEESESESDPEPEESEELEEFDEVSSESPLLSRSGAETSCPKTSLIEPVLALFGSPGGDNDCDVGSAHTPEVRL